MEWEILRLIYVTGSLIYKVDASAPEAFGKDKCSGCSSSACLLSLSCLQELCPKVAVVCKKKLVNQTKFRKNI